ncbi:hypothetical protein PFMC_06047, partial [Plasmodium falciparum CAMP/Malaysia]
EEEEEDDKDDHEVEEDHGTTVETDPPAAVVDHTEAPTAKKDEAEKVCQIVANILTKDTTALNEACKQKYENGKERYTQWYCASKSDATTGDKGAICVPPRRRRLYVKKLHDWAEEATKSQSQEISGGQKTPVSGGDTGSQSDKLRTAFIESAAVETFFLWDRYKKENTKTQSGVGSLPLLNRGTLGEEDEDNKDPEKQLKEGTIPEEFKRQMFYTLGDYRDICVGNTDIVVEALSSSEKQKMKEIEKKIKEILNKTNGGTSPVHPKTDSEKLKSWWEENGPHIWNAMVCALTYTEKSGSGGEGKTTITQDDSLKEALLHTNKNTPKTEYQYNSVKLEDTSGAKSTEASPTKALPTKAPSTSDNTPTTLNNPKLKDFVEIPTFFRYLHEWGQNFCKKRTDKLKKLEKECRGVNYSGYNKYCSGDGHDCEKNSLKHHKMFEDSLCSGCYEQCRKYRKWIDIKFVEYHNQKNKYEKEIQNVRKSSNNDDDQKFYQKLKEKDYSSVEKFLESLNHCNLVQSNSDQTNKIKFNEPLKTFSPSTYCKTCPLYGVNCRNNSGNCTHIKENVFTRQNNLDTIKILDTSPTSIDIEMIDHRGQYIQEDVKNLFKESYLFKSVRDQNWICRFIHNKLDECKLNDFNPKIDTDESITFKVLIERWLQDFLEGYKQSKKKIDLCTIKEENKCIEGCKGKCEYVGKWVEKKTTEWGKIKEHFNKQDRGKEYHIAYKVRMCFEQEPFFSAFINAIKGDKDIEGFEKFASCEHQDCYNRFIRDINHDFITKLLESLKTKAKTCVDTSLPRGDTQPTCADEPPLEDEEEEDYENENTEEAKKNMIPKICDGVIKPEPETDGDCTPAGTLPKEEGENDEKGDKGDSEKSKEEGGEGP